MMTSKTYVVTLLSALVIHGVANDAVAQTCHTAQGTERRAVLNAARPPVQRDLKQPVEFVVHTIRVCDNWAFVIADMQKSGGSQIDWSNTVCSGDVSHLVGALLNRSAGKAWVVKTYALCPTDVPWVDWAEAYDAPPALWE